jgi:hypothetical protein
MPRTAIPIVDLTRAGTAYTPVAADTVNGNYLDTPERCVLFLANGTGSPIVISIPFNGTFDGLAVSARTISVPANTTLMVGNLYGPAHFQGIDVGRLYLDSPSASLNVVAMRFPPGLA